MRKLQATTWREGDLFVAQCLEVDIASQGSTSAEALENLREAVELFFESASENEIRERVRENLDLTHFEIAVG